MKKFVLTFCAMIATIILCTVTALAKNYTIPQCAVPPTIDGKMSKNEYYGAYHKFMNNDKGNYDYSSHPDQTEDNKREECKGYDIYMYWYNDPNESGKLLDVKQGGLYICVKAQDKSKSFVFKDGQASNASDCIQIFIDPLNIRSNSNAMTYCFDFSPETQTAGKALIYEHYQYKSKPQETFLYQVKAHRDKNIGYTMEIFIPWSLINMKNKVPPHRVGTKMGIGIIAMDWIQQSPYYNIADFGGGKDIETIAKNARTLNTVTFGETVYPPGYTPNGDLTKITELIKEAETLLKDEKLYVPATFSAFKLALESAKKVASTDKQDVIDKAYKALEDAKNALKKTSDVTPFEALSAAVEAAEKLVETDYHPETWERVKNALETAKKITGKTPEAEIKTAIDELNAAINGLVSIEEELEKANLNDLLNVLTKFETLTEADYTPESWAAVKTAYEEAVKVKDNKASNQFEIDEACNKLTAAIDALVSASGENPEVIGGDKENKPSEANKGGLKLGHWIAIIVVVIAATVAIILVAKRKTPAKATDEKPENKDEKKDN